MNRGCLSGKTLALVLVFLVIAPVVRGQTISKKARQHMTCGQAAVEKAKKPADYEKAIREFERAAKLAPDWPEIYYNLGVVQEKVKLYGKAIENLKKYLALTPDAKDADAVRDLIYKIEFLIERGWGKIEGVWGVDKDETDVICDPKGYVIIPGNILNSLFTVEDIVLEIKKELNKYSARVLSSKHRFGGMMPDGPYVTVKHEGNMVKIFGVTMYTCSNDVMSNNCPWKANFVLEQISGNTLEGTIKISGIVKKVVDYSTFETRTFDLSCDGKIVLWRRDGSRKVKSLKSPRTEETATQKLEKILKKMGYDE